jgi:protein-S-isoprenylcysteine O-methyltransferase Ste14
VTAAASGERDVAGVIAPPPLIYVAALLLGLGLNALLPSPDSAGTVVVVVGIVLIVAGSALALSFVGAFRRAGTAIDPYRRSDHLVTSGPYRLSRNPGYLGMALVYAGIVALVAAPWAYLTLAIALVVMDRGVIAREERYLERRFGDDYRRYKARTRRWI